MLKKLLSTFKALQTAAHNQAESEAADAISSPEKIAALVARLDAAMAATAPNSERYIMLKRQHAEALLAGRRHQIESESQRVAGALLRDRANGEKSLEKAKQGLAQADGVFQQKEARHLAVLARLKPLESQLTLAIQHTADHLRDAQAAFDAAVSKGDEPAEMAAAETLYQLKIESKNPAGPLHLRLAAIRSEEIEAGSALAVAELGQKEANNAVLQAQATLALVEYDRQAQALLDAYVAQAVAVAKCGGNVFAASRIDSFEAQVSSAERIVFGQRMEAFSKRHISAFLVRDMISDMTKEPDLAILGVNVEDIAEPPPEAPVDRRMRQSAGLVGRADGSVEEVFMPLRDDVAQEQAA